ncbi:MAG: hypothetical protein INH41_09515 [Myxococcaceae bacterium]|jgi:hypothetical protein|nr:hypothetical protein [Myxococcaceae bacterium]MCA3012621.1 hypothetical protein [Myxococcaceae bacterium]
MRALVRLLARWPASKALRAACVLGLCALTLMALGVVFATPLPVVAAMSVAQGLGVVACLLFGLSIAADVASRRP